MQLWMVPRAIFPGSEVSKCILLPSIKANLSAMHSDTPGKLRVKAKRPFDAYTWSIWAKNMSERGKTDEAVSMLENVIAQKKLGGGTEAGPRVLFNTAIDACGHAGKFNRAWSLFNDVRIILALFSSCGV